MPKITKIISLLVFMMAFRFMYGQTDHPYNIYAQAFGSSTGIGIGLDSRFKTDGVLGYSVGLAYADISWDDCAGFGDIYSKGLGIPIEINALFGKRASKFEVGIGVTAYLINREESHLRFVSTINGNDGAHIPDGELTHKKSFRPNIIGAINLGYRLQRKSGFFMKIGVSILFGDHKCSPFDSVVALPGLCLGYTIPHF